jgi:hypothetical protein
LYRVFDLRGLDRDQPVQLLPQTAQAVKKAINNKPRVNLVKTHLMKSIGSSSSPISAKMELNMIA